MHEKKYTFSAYIRSEQADIMQAKQENKLDVNLLSKNVCDVIPMRLGIFQVNRCSIACKPYIFRYKSIKQKYKSQTHHTQAFAANMLPNILGQKKTSENNEKQIT